ncbi:chaperone modulator CbpM [Gaetbulibacter saemankumensis]|uniref:chaperone modulator CbpM n=1 Tax=Gaetbulibacter saemankumensis TaxID=311208 RepID=UPI00040CF3A7|nr:chaperone modulator CbpM [Gaetbulibacter saemankumensis]
MAIPEYIPIAKLSKHYTIEMAFFEKLHNEGLIELITIEKTTCLHQDYLHTFEKIMRIHNDLDINIEGIDVVLNLLNKVDELHNELHQLKSRLNLYEND